MKKVKILLFSQSAQVAGAEMTLLVLVRALDKSKFEPVVVFPSPGPIRDLVEQCGVRTYICPFEWWGGQKIKRGLAGTGQQLYRTLVAAIRTPPQFDARSLDIQYRVSQLERLIEKERPDIVHTNTTIIWESALAAKRQGVPHIWHAHEFLDDNPGCQTLFPLPLLYWIIEQLSHKVVAVSQVLQSRLGQYIASNKLHCIYNGVEAERFDASEVQANINRKALCNELALNEDDIIVLTMATVLPEKGIDNLLETAAQVSQQSSRIKFVLAGRSSRWAVKALRRKLRQLRIEDSFFYLGLRHDTPQLLSGCDFVVVPSVVETFSLALVEAMASGKPTVSTACGGPSEILVNGQTGWLVPVNDAPALADKIIELANDAGMRQAMGRHARRHFEEKFRSELFVNKFEELYLAVAASKETVTSSDNLTAGLIQLYSQVDNKSLRRARGILMGFRRLFIKFRPASQKP